MFSGGDDVRGDDVTPPLPQSIAKTLTACASLLDLQELYTGTQRPPHYASNWAQLVLDSYYFKTDVFGLALWRLHRKCPKYVELQKRYKG